MAKFKKGQKKTEGSGRKKGSVNKSSDIRNAFYNAFFKLGGIPELVKWGKNNRTEYYKILAKLMPKEIELGDTSHQIVLVRPNGNKTKDVSG